jgi:tRNA dimethylallyltransferase
MGPTASGKTDLAIEIYDKKDIEIISVDSALIYRDMNIGTAKPDLETLKKYPHKLVNIISPEEEYSAQNFIDDSLGCIENAIKNNKTPVLVGGTSFYFNALENGLSNLPASTKKSREYVNNLISNLGLERAYQELKKVDNISAQKIHKNDNQRVSRALEVYYLTDKPLSELQGNKTNYLQNFKVNKFAVMPTREELHQRIKKRFDLMLEQGFVAEVESLREKYNLSLDKPAMRCVGYRQIWQYLDGNLSYEAMREKGIIATRQLSKRQKTWLRSMQNVEFISNFDIEKLLKFC